MGTIQAKEKKKEKRQHDSVGANTCHLVEKQRNKMMPILDVCREIAKLTDRYWELQGEKMSIFVPPSQFTTQTKFRRLSLLVWGEGWGGDITPCNPAFY